MSSFWRTVVAMLLWGFALRGGVAVSEPMNLMADPDRGNIGESGIFVRALRDGRWESVDIVELDADSLLKFLRARGGDNPWAEDVVGILLGHGHLHKRGDAE